MTSNTSSGESDWRAGVADLILHLHQWQAAPVGNESTAAWDRLQGTINALATPAPAVGASSEPGDIKTLEKLLKEAQKIIRKSSVRHQVPEWTRRTAEALDALAAVGASPEPNLREACAALLSLIRRDAPHLSGKVLGEAEAALSSVGASVQPVLAAWAPHQHSPGRWSVARPSTTGGIIEYLEPGSPLVHKREAERIAAAANAVQPVLASLSDEQWYDLASRHATRDWNSDGYLDSVKALVLAALASSTPTQPPGAATPKGGE